MKPKIEIISHCWTGMYRHYADALVYQLSSFILHAPEHAEVFPTICCIKSDVLTLEVLGRFKTRLPNLRALFLPNPGYLGRRSIGRNRAALATRADFVWFADVDQVYGPGCLDRLVTMEWPKDAVMIFPKVIKISKDHITGDQTTQKAQGDDELIEINPEDFVDKIYHRAIGGVQIVKGDFARTYGYIGDTQAFQLPVDKPFGSFKDDIVYRRCCQLHGKIRGVNLPGMYRLRHTTTSYR